MPASRTDATPTQPSVIRTLHWLTLLVLLLTFSLVLVRDGLEDRGWLQWTLSVHRYLGIAVWLLACVRLVVRSRLPMADTLLVAPRWQQWAAGAVHGLLYLLLLAVPLLGLALTNARGHAVVLPWVGTLPNWPGRDLDLADSLESVHRAAAWTLTTLVGLHAAVALWHHTFLRDDVLLAMLPRRVALEPLPAGV
jgi:cytochrome b561